MSNQKYELAHVLPRVEALEAEAVDPEHKHDEDYAPVEHDHPHNHEDDYAPQVHEHPHDHDFEYSEIGHKHPEYEGGGGDTGPHNHDGTYQPVGDYAEAEHDHDTSHTHDEYAASVHEHDTSHDHDGEYQPVGDYSTTDHKHPEYEGGGGGPHTHDEYADKDHTHGDSGGGIDFQTQFVFINPGRVGNFTSSTFGTSGITTVQEAHDDEGLFVFLQHMELGITLYVPENYPPYRLQIEGLLWQGSTKRKIMASGGAKIVEGPDETPQAEWTEYKYEVPLIRAGTAGYYLDWSNVATHMGVINKVWLDKRNVYTEEEIAALLAEYDTPEDSK